VGSGSIHPYQDPQKPEERRKFSRAWEVAGPVRDFSCIEKHRTVVINRGIHGVDFGSYDGERLATAVEPDPSLPIDRVAVSPDLDYAILTSQRDASVHVFAASG